jgi:ABC-type lipoprotein export system ATPase subunit
MNKITVAVSGPAGSGKSTIMELIYKMLEDRGFKTTVTHLDISDRDEWNKNLERRVSDMIERDNTTISITEHSKCFQSLEEKINE